MNWFDLLVSAEARAAAEDAGASAIFVSAIETAQNELGAYHPEVGKCFCSYARFLEQSGHIEGARLNYKLAAAIFAIAGETTLSSLAADDGVRMDKHLGLPARIRHPISNESMVSD